MVQTIYMAWTRNLQPLNHPKVNTCLQYPCDIIFMFSACFAILQGLTRLRRSQRGGEGVVWFRAIGSGDSFSISYGSSTKIRRPNSASASASTSGQPLPIGFILENCSLPSHPAPSEPHFPSRRYGWMMFLLLSRYSL